MRHGSAGFPPGELRRGGANLWQAVLVEGLAGVLCAGCRALRMELPEAGATADARRKRAADRLGVGTATFPAIMFQGQARAVLRRDGTGLVELGAHDMGQGAWTALAQIAADSLGLDLDQLEF